MATARFNFCSSCFGNAYLAVNTPLIAGANILFGIAFISLDALKKRNGLYEYYFE